MRGFYFAFTTLCGFNASLLWSNTTIVLSFRRFVMVSGHTGRIGLVNSQYTQLLHNEPWTVLFLLWVIRIVQTMWPT